MTYGPQQLLLFVALLIFSVGFLTTLAGVLILIFGAAGKDIRALAADTARLAQKGITEDVAGLVGNATVLLDGIHQLVRTTAGIGVFLSIFGLIIMLTSVAAAVRILQMPS